MFGATSQTTTGKNRVASLLMRLTKVPNRSALDTHSETQGAGAKLRLAPIAWLTLENPCDPELGADSELTLEKVGLVTTDAATPNDPKLSDRGVRRGTCAEGGEGGGQEAGAVRPVGYL